MQTTASVQFSRTTLIIAIAAIIFLMLTGCRQHSHDIIITNGIIYDGSGEAPQSGGLAIRDRRITHVGDLPEDLSAPEVIDAAGKAVAPGFINMLSWAGVPLIEDGRSMSNIKQGVTLEVMGEGSSMGPLTDRMALIMENDQTDITYDVTWRTLEGFLEHLTNRGVSTNVASFVGATTVRRYILGNENVSPTPSELEQMQQLVRETMEQGAMGLSSALIYAPAWYADTGELVALADAAADYGGLYATHLRSEGDRLLEAVEEMLEITEQAGIASHIHHLKAAGSDNRDKLDEVIERVERAQASGWDISANMYLYTAAATRLTATIPPWAREGGRQTMIERFQNPLIRERILNEMESPDTGWENFLQMVESPDDITLTGFRTEELQRFVGWTLSEVARGYYGLSPAETILELIAEDDYTINAVYHLMSEENVRKKVQLPWVTFGSDSGSMAAEGLFLNRNPHPRAYGNFARLLGLYVRDEGLITLQEAIRRMTSYPASLLGIDDERGKLETGCFADIVIFDPDEIQDHATYDQPHRYATGVSHVLVNGTPVLYEGEHTGSFPGMVVRGPGYVEQ